MQSISLQNALVDKIESVQTKATKIILKVKNNI